MRSNFMLLMLVRLVHASTVILANEITYTIFDLFKSSLLFSNRSFEDFNILQ